MSEPRVFSVSELSGYIQKVLEKHPLLTSLWVRGEISNFKRHTSGHLYFSLKDQSSSIRAVMFRSRAGNLKFLPADGMDCLFRGYISLYSRDSTIQVYVEEIIPAGLGIQQQALEALKKKLQAQGFFSQERKRSLPLLPRGVGVVTSPVGAALRDIQKVTLRRYPGMPIYLYPALVQGDRAVQTVVEGIKTLGAYAPVDVIIVARGGGSVEDLGVFNTEAVAEAVYHSPKPVISAIGHEIDITITDLVADVRAATPSMAGELAVPVKEELHNGLDKHRERLGRVLKNRLEKEIMRLAFLAEAGIMKKPQRWLDRYQEELARKETRLIQGFSEIYKSKDRELRIKAGKLQALSPLATLARGYSICKGSGGVVITDSSKVRIKEEVEVRLFAGKLDCLVLRKEEGHEPAGGNL